MSTPWDKIGSLFFFPFHSLFIISKGPLRKPGNYKGAGGFVHVAINGL